MQYDILIVGGNLVGALAALALAQTGRSVALVECAPPPVFYGEALSAELDTRIYAISPANIAFLQQLGVWQSLPIARLQTVQQMHIHADNAALELDAETVQQTQLAMIVESQLLQNALWQALLVLDNVRIITEEPLQLMRDARQVRLTLANAEILHAQVIIGADGANSWVRAQSAISMQQDDYAQMGVVAAFATEKPHNAIAKQWFLPDTAILAWLPLPYSATQGNRISMVWSSPIEQAKTLCSLSAEELSQQVQAAGHATLGNMTALSSAQAFPLRRQRSSSLVENRLVLIGDAAHTMHPLAGQGVNVGLQDVQTLLNVLNARQKQGKKDAGDWQGLRQFARQRAEPIAMMQQTTHYLYHLFAQSQPFVRLLRNHGLGITQQMTWLKQQLIRYALS